MIPPPLVPRCSLPPPPLNQPQRLCSCAVSWVRGGENGIGRAGLPISTAVQTYVGLKWLHYQSLAELSEKTDLG